MMPSNEDSSSTVRTKIELRRQKILATGKKRLDFITGRSDSPKLLPEELENLSVQSEKELLNKDKLGLTRLTLDHQNKRMVQQRESTIRIVFLVIYSAAMTWVQSNGLNSFWMQILILFGFWLPFQSVLLFLLRLIRRINLSKTSGNKSIKSVDRIFIESFENISDFLEHIDVFYRYLCDFLLDSALMVFCFIFFKLILFFWI